MYELAEFYVDHLGGIVIGVALLSAIGQIIYYVVERTAPDLQTIVLKTLAGAGLPVGLGLVICAFDISLIAKIFNATVYVLISGICIIYVSIMSVFPNLTPPPGEPPPARPGRRNT